MKKTLLFLLISCFLIGCNKNNYSNESIQETYTNSQEQLNKNYYASINSINDVVYIYGIVGESFDLEEINTSNVLNKNKTYVANNDGLILENNILKMQKTGFYELEIKDNKNSIKVLVSVNKDESSRYNYPENIDFEDYTQPSDAKGNVNINENSISLISSSTWNRITIPINDYYAKNYTIECDASFKSAKDNNRWLGLIFKSDDSLTGYPYYQLDIRKATNKSNSIELTYLPGPTSNNYSYLYQSSWNEGGPGLLTSSDKIHMKVEISNQIAKCYLDLDNYHNSFDVNIADVSGTFGFSCSDSEVLFENIKLSLNKDTKVLSFVDGSKTRININDEYDVSRLKPALISSGVDIEEIDGISLKCQQYYVKIKNDGLYSLCDEKMDYNFSNLLSETIGDYILNIEIENEDIVDKILPIIKSYGLSDLAIWSSNELVLDKIKKEYPVARRGYVANNISSLNTYAEVSTIAKKAGKHYANMIMIDANLLNKDNVHKFDGLGYSVVANAKYSNNYELLKASLAGVKLIASSYSKEANKQATMLYNNDIFDFDESSSSIYNQTHSLLSIPYVTGHRGAGTNDSNIDVTLPENTIESFKWALDNGAEAIEIDIHETSDHKYAVIHDDNTQAYSTSNLKVSTSTLSQLQSIPLKVGNNYLKNYHIPSLEEVFEELSEDKYANKTIVIEIKDLKASTGIGAIELAKKYNWYDRITIITFDATTAKKIKDYDPSIQVSYLGTVSRQDNEQYWQSYNSYLVNGVNLASQYSTISAEAIQESNARGQMYWLWTFDYTDGATLLNHILNGNRAFTTNYIGAFGDNFYKLSCNYDKSLNMNQSLNFDINAISFSNNNLNVNDKAEIILLSDNATVNNNKITRTKDKTIYGFVKYKTAWNLYNTTTNFTIYSDMFEIN